MGDKKIIRMLRLGTVRMLAGASALALVAAGPWSSEAAAQQGSPNSPQCPRVDGTVTCTANLSDGYSDLGTGPGYTSLIIRDLTGPIRPNLNQPGIAVLNRNLTIEIADGVLIDVTGDAGGISAIRFFGGNLDLRNAADISASLDGEGNAFGINAGNSFDMPTGNYQITNSGDISVTGTGRTFGRSAAIFVRPNLSQSSNRPATRSEVQIINSGRLTITDSETASQFSLGSEFARVGIGVQIEAGGVVDIRNSGAIQGGNIAVGVGDRLLGETTVRIDNSGALTDARIYVSNEFMRLDDNPAPTTTGAFYDVGIANSGTITRGTIRAVFGGPASTESRVRGGILSITNDANIDLRGDASQFGLGDAISAEMFRVRDSAGEVRVTVINHGDLFSDSDRSGGIRASSSDILEVTNSGDISRTGTGFLSGITLAQNDGINYVSPVTLANSGAILLRGGSGSHGIEVLGGADIVIANSGAIAVEHGPGTTTGRLFETAGIWLHTRSDASLVNSGAITMTGARQVGISFTEISFINGALADARGYEQAADLASAFNIVTNADVTASGVDSFGIVGFMGSNGDGDGDNLVFNDQATARIAVGPGATVTGGTGRGSAILTFGKGTITLENQGTIVGQGNAGTAALLIGGLFDFGNGDDFDPEDRPNPSGPPLRMDLVNSINGGTVRSTDGYGVWAQTGAITNFTNRGLILGGQGSIRAAFGSSIVNDTAGILDGPVLLEGAGSSLVNSGIIRNTSGTAAAHLVNGDFTQDPGGSLVLANGDTMNVTGAFVLTGILDLALGAPSSNPIISVGGDLSIDGLLNVTDAGGFGSGIYRLFNYGGALTDNALEIGALPEGARGSIQTAIPGQVNLLVTGGRIQFWDGANTTGNNQVDGGSGTWDNSTTNWTAINGQINETWVGEFAVFQGNSGTVTIAPGGVTSSGLQFAVSGYRIEGDALNLTAPATLRVGDGSAAGAGFTATIASTLAGSAGIDKTDLGTLVLTGTNLYSGGTRISGGILEVNADAALGAASGGVTFDGGTLRAGGDLGSARSFFAGAGGGTLDTQAHGVTLSGTVTGSGALAKTGTGALVLSGDGGAYAGTFTLAGGSLRLDGSLGGALAVNAGTRLGGTGMAGNLSIAGTLAPGNSIGTLTASGNVTFASGSTFEVEVDPGGSSDRLTVSGVANIQGGTVSALFLGNQNAACGSSITSTILSAQGGVTGAFSGVTANFAFLTPTLTYDANNVMLTLTRNAATFSERGATANQRSSAAAAERLGCGNAVFDAIVPLDAATARYAFDQLSGEIHASAGGALLEDSRFFRDAMLASRQRRGLWSHAYGSWGRIEGDGNAGALDRNGAGAFIGADLALGGAWSASIGGGYSRADYNVDARLSSAEVESWHFGASLAARLGRLSLRAGAALAWHRVEADRIIAFGGFTESASARYDGETRQLFARAGYELAFGRAVIEPFAELAFVEVSMDPFAEAGGAAALSGEARSEDALFTTIGARVSAELGEVGLRGRLGWRHAFDAEPGLATFAFAGEDGFSIAGTPISVDHLAAEAGIDFEFAQGARIGIGYTGQIGNRSEDHGARATLSLSF